MMDTGIRIGDSASMLQFGLEVHPSKSMAFRAQTQNAISDATRHKFVPGATVYVKFNPKVGRFANSGITEATVCSLVACSGRS